ncbi:amino acid adenylation domain-containing protein [Rhizobium helianthi]|uniref:Amino acid adenylation domain-containing protein n=1 Tax=Rhizobium helianthi TaxID=1132695 RepID=A0ABW4M185_9HYPH
MRNASRESLAYSKSNSMEESAASLPSERTGIAISHMPADWGGEAAVSDTVLQLTGDFSRSVASELTESWLKGARSLLPVFAFTLATFTDATAVLLQVEVEGGAHQAVQIVYDLDEASSFSAMAAHTEVLLSRVLHAVDESRTKSLHVRVLDSNSGQEIDFHFAVSEQGLSVTVSAASEQLFAGWLAHVFECFDFYGTQFQCEPIAPHSAIKLVPPRQWDVLKQINDTATDYPRDSDLISILLASSASHSDETALIAGAKHTTFSALLARARSIAAWLTSICDPSGRGVGVVVDRNENAYAIYIGILMAGGYYVPVSPKNPASRIGQIFADADVCVALMLDRGEEVLDGAHALDAIPLEAAPHFQPRQRTPDSIAYAIYTSGSTGKPKGVLVTDRNVLRFAINAAHITWKAEDRMGAISSHGFDASTFEIWSALLNNIPIVCLGKDAITDLEVFEKIVQEQQVTVMVITSALLTHIVSANIDALAPLRYLVYGGELTPIETVRRLRTRFPELELIHAYGPTENTVLSTFHSVEALPPERVPIGRPLSNSGAWVVDAGFRPLPVGARGMLVVSGDGVAQGYMKRPEATAKHFVPMPEHLRQRDDERGYITGDIARWNDQFALEFLGRADNQIKIRGFRVELDEIRAILTGLPDVIDAEVIPVAAEHGGTAALEAFVVTQAASTEPIRARLAQHLPDYMVPRVFHKIESLPFNSSGKVDRQALATLRSAAPSSEALDARNDTDRRLLEIWKRLFGVPSLSIDDSYTSLGGHSMMMVEMADMVFDEFNLDIALTDLVVLTTVRQVSDVLAQQMKQAELS